MTHETIKPQGQNIDTCSVARPSGKQTLISAIGNLRQRADDLQALHDMLPTKLTGEQEAALWNIGCQLNMMANRL